MKLTPWPQETDITIANITVKNAKVSRAFVFDLPKILNDTSIEIKFIWEKGVRALPQWLFVLEYNNIQDRNNDADLFNKNFEKRWFFSKQLPEWYQIPENAGIFEYNQSHFLILNAYNQQIGVNNNFSHQGVILDIPSYFESIQKEEGVQNLTQKVANSVLDLVPEKE